MNFWRKAVSVDGTDQRERFPQPLRDGYFRLDETTFEDQLALTARFASRLRFFNVGVAAGLDSRGQLGQAVDGNWGDLFSSDESALMADILSTDVRGLRTTLEHRIEEGGYAGGGFIYELAGTFSRWMDGLGAIDRPSARALYSKIDEIVQQRLSSELAQLKTYFDEIHAGSIPSGASPRTLGPSWRAEAPAPFSPLSRSAPGFASWETRFLESCGDSFLHAIAYLQSIVPPFLEESLESKTHNPAVALFAAFLKIFGRAQESLNTVTGRHRDFYYRDLLKIVPRESIPDSAWLVLQADATARAAVVAEGTPFLAGKDGNGRDITFLADNAIRVTDTRVRDIRTLSLERDPLISPERELGYVTRARSHRFPTLTGTEAMWPVLGAEGKEGYRGTAEDSEIGFALASPVLYLREGTRTLVVDLELSDADADEVVASLAAEGLLLGSHGLNRDKFFPALRRVLVRYLRRAPRLVGTGPAALESAAEKIAAKIGGSFMDRLGGGSAESLYDTFLLELLDSAETPDAFFFHVLGKIFRRYLLRPVATESDAAFGVAYPRIQQIADRVLSDDSWSGSREFLQTLLNEPRGVLYGKILRGAFRITLTTASGWTPALAYSTLALPKTSGAEMGMRLEMRLTSESEPVVPCVPAIHGTGWNTEFPVIRFHLDTQSAFCHYSLFEGLLIREAAMQCHVSGVRTVVAYNNEGQLDPSKPFLPFGPLPSRGSYFIIGQPELARKQVSKLKLHIVWGSLPGGYGGFRTHYEGYRNNPGEATFEVSVGGLREGSWYPADREKRTRLSLFDEMSGNVVSDTVTLDLDAVRHLSPVPFAGVDEPFTYDLKTRTGFVSLTLENPETAFGHADYSGSMTRVLTENARLKRPRPLPNPPYTPLVTQLTLEYVARDSILASSDVASGAGAGPQIYELHPFGMRSVYPVVTGVGPRVLPEHFRDGNLFIGMESTDPRGVLTLFFHMAEDSSRPPRKGRTTEDTYHALLSWSYLGPDGWRPLDAGRILSDSTHGFLRSGIVTLDLPADISNTNTMMPEGLFWLRAGASECAEGFSSLFSVYAQGLRVTRRLDPATEFSGEHLPEGSVRQVGAAVPVLTEMRHIGATFDGRGVETADRLNTRVSERLRHKNRATTPWDYERLVLEKFPEVFKVKCLANVVAESSEPAPGNVMVVVVPAGTTGVLRPRFDAVELEDMQRFLSSVASPSAQIQVRNPNYERIQVRCSVKFRRSDATGFQVTRLCSEIINFLSPWTAGGYQARFGWCLRSEDIQSFIGSLDFVEYVTAFSILHVASDLNERYRLEDTARFWPLTAGSFTDFDGFVRAIRDSNSGLGFFLRDHLETRTLRLLGDWDGGDLSRAKAATILSDINRILASEDLQRAVRSERGEAVDLKKENTLALNRRLLEDWAAETCLASPARTQEVRPSYPWSIAVPMETHWIETLDARRWSPAKPAGIAGLEIGSNFIIS